MLHKSVQAPGLPVKSPVFSVSLPHITPVAGLLIRSAIIILAALVVLQIIWPSTHAKPLQKIDGSWVGFSHEDTNYKNLKKTTDAIAINLYIDDDKMSVKPADFGVLIDLTATVEETHRYTMKQRLIPFSLFKYSDQPVAFTQNVDIAEEFLQKISENPKHPAVNYSIVINDDFSIEIIEGADGIGIDSSEFTRTIDSLAVTQYPKEIRLTSNKQIAPVVNEEIALNKKQQLEKWSTKEVVLTANGKQTTISKNELLQIVAIKEEPAELLFEINEKKLRSLFAAKKPSLEIQTIPSISYTKNGKETSSISGAKGSSIDIDDAILQLSEYFESTLLKKAPVFAEPIELITTSLQPSVKTIPSYTQDTEGLNALLKDVRADLGDASITVIDLANGQSADSNGTQLYHPASTYKLFVAHSLLKRIDSGTVKWSDDAIDGKTISTCFDEMIVQSKNECAKWFGKDLIGWSAIQSEMRSMGISGVTLASGTGFTSNTNSVSLFLQKLATTDSLSTKSKARLIDAMKGQIHRSGIPKGVVGTVADKPGFLNGLLHDAAIVYGPKSTYVVVIYSNGSSWSKIADASARIDAFMQQ